MQMKKSVLVACFLLPQKPPRATRGRRAESGKILRNKHCWNGAEAPSAVERVNQKAIRNILGTCCKQGLTFEAALSELLRLAPRGCKDLAEETARAMVLDHCIILPGGAPSRKDGQGLWRGDLFYVEPETRKLLRSPAFKG